MIYEFNVGLLERNGKCSGNSANSWHMIKFREARVLDLVIQLTGGRIESRFDTTNHPVLVLQTTCENDTEALLLALTLAVYLGIPHVDMRNSLSGKGKRVSPDHQPSKYNEDTFRRFKP